MVPIESLIIPIVLAAVLVFVASSLIHMVFKYHNSDYKGIANEDAVRAAIRASAPVPGQYFMPYCIDHSELKKPEVVAKFTEGPVAMLTVRPSGPPTMGAALGQWFALNVVVAIIAGYLASRLVPPGASFLAVARVVSLTTFVAYGGGAVTHAIWMGKPWSSAVKELFDAFLYGLVTSAAFGFLWPK